MSSELSSGSNATSPSLTGKKRGVDGPAPRAQPEDTSDVQFPEDGMPLNPGEQTVQFIPGQDPSNGDAKVEIGESAGQPKFVGLGKEELMKFANDPFWVRLRWILFILFWLIWLAMLAGAVVIILYAPKCADKLIGPTSGPYYHLDVKGFPGKSLQGVSTENVDYLEALGVKSVIISQVLETDNGKAEGVMNFKNVDVSYGGLEGFNKLVERLKSKAIKVILQFIPNHSSIQHSWFRNEPTQSEYYVLKDASVESKWVSQTNNNASAWTEIPGNENQTYLHQFSSSEADLNFRNPQVIKEMNSALAFWYGLGVDGFLLSKISYLRENLEKLDEQSAMINQPSNDIIVKKILDHSGWNLTGSDGLEREPPFALVELEGLEKFPGRTSTFYSENTAVISNSLADLGVNFTAQDLKKAIEDTIAATPRNPVHWRLGSLSSRPSQRFGEQKSQALTLVAALLRGQLVLNYGDENGISASGVFQQRGSDHPSVKFLREVLQATVALNQTGAGGGTTEYLTPDDKPGIFVMKRVNDNTYIVAANFGEEKASAPLESFKEEAEAKVLAATPNAGIAAATISAKDIELPPNSAVVLEIKKE